MNKKWLPHILEAENKEDLVVSIFHMKYNTSWSLSVQKNISLVFL